METLEQLQSIIDNAPSGSTHVDEFKAYWKFIPESCYYFHNGKKWDGSESIEYGTRSLSDIRRIIELEKKLAEK